MAIGIRLTVDFAFKQTLGNPQYTDVTVHFLNSVLQPKSRIESVEILNPTLPKESESHKESLLDILAVDERGCRLNIEMQTSLPGNLRRRLVYYTSRLFYGQLQEGEDYDLLRAAINICVVDRPLIVDPPQLHRDFRLRDSRGETLCDDFQLHLLQLPFAQATEHNAHALPGIEQWAFFLRNAHHYDAETLCRILPDPVFAKALEIVTMIAKTPEQRYYYEARLKAQRDEAARLAFAREEGLEAGRAAGHAEGRAEGLDLGETIGRIGLLQKILGDAPETTAELRTWSRERLIELLAELESRWERRTG